ncbi:hypothetical protein C8J57DRAFT_1491379 [Mycena rebaudengoi]|nr:hypothetical protein C8J57DRAFT_1491379 [Mycena rebaudengoi]
MGHMTFAPLMGSTLASSSSLPTTFGACIEAGPSFWYAHASQHPLSWSIWCRMSETGRRIQNGHLSFDNEQVWDLEVPYVPEDSTATKPENEHVLESLHFGGNSAHAGESVDDRATDINTAKELTASNEADNNDLADDTLSIIAAVKHAILRFL